MLAHSIENSKEDQEHLAVLDPKFAPVLMLVVYHIDGIYDEDNTADEYYPIDDEDEDLDQEDENSLDEDNVDNDKDDGDLGEEDDHKGEGDYDGSDDAGTEEGDDSDDQEEYYTLFFYNIAKRDLLAKRVDGFVNHLYWITAQGWLLMVHFDSHETFLWSPITDQKINLPFDEDNFLTNKNNVVTCSLSHKPSDPNCIVLVVNCKNTIFWYCRPKGDVWFKHKYQSSMISTREDRQNVITTVKHLTSVGGRFHGYLYNDKAILTLEFLPKPTFTTTPVKAAPDPSYWCTFYTRCLLESDGELFKLSFKHPIECVEKVVKIEVHKLNLCERIWMKVSTIDNKAFLVDCTGFGASLNAEDVGLKRNCIYFVRPKDKGLYVYNMERGTTTIHNPGEDLPDNLTPEIVMPPS